MNKKVAVYVNELFAGVPQQPQVLEIKEELLANLMDKYQDLLDSGKSEDEAYSLVVSGIGNIDDLLRDFTGTGAYSPIEDEKKRAIKNLFISVGAALYVLSLAVFLLFEWLGWEDIGKVMMMLFCAAATGLIVYGVNAGKTRYQKRNDSFVEQYKEKIADDERTASLKKAVSSALWPLIVVIYLALSFFTHMWNITWIIFVIGAFAQQFIMLYLFPGSAEKGKLAQGMFWTGTAAVYLIISFAFRAWAWSWMIFIAAAAVQQIIRLMTIWRNDA